MQLTDEYGNVMVDIASVERKGDNLLLRGKMMGTMPGSFVMRPNQLWSGLKLVTWPVVAFAPRMLFMGWRQPRASRVARRSAGS